MNERRLYILMGLGIILLAVLIVIILSRRPATEIEPVPPQTETETETTELSLISDLEDNSDTYSITYFRVEGDSPLARETNRYVETAIAEFKTLAEADFEAAVAEFGELPPFMTNGYQLILEPELIVNQEVTSLIINEYRYTGGANGSSAITTFNYDASNQPLELRDLILDSDEANFFRVLIEEMKNFSLYGQTEPGNLFFPGTLEQLSFADITDWAINDQTVLIYFDEYQVAAGAAGSFAVEIPRAKIESYLVQQ